MGNDPVTNPTMNACKRAGLEVNQVCRTGKGHGAHDHQLAGGPFEVGLVEQALQQRRYLQVARAAGSAMECR